jgi:hypothetical protein
MFELYCDTCTDNAVSLDSDVTLFFYLALDTASGTFSYSDIQNEVDDKFLKNGGSSSNSECDAIYFYAC